MKSNPNPNPNPNLATKQHAIVYIQLNIVTCPPYPDKFIAPSVRLQVVTVTLSWCERSQNRIRAAVSFTENNCDTPTVDTGW